MPVPPHQRVIVMSQDHVDLRVHPRAVTCSALGPLGMPRKADLSPAVSRSYIPIDDICEAVRGEDDAIGRDTLHITRDRIRVFRTHQEDCRDVLDQQVLKVAVQFRPGFRFDRASRLFKERVDVLALFSRKVESRVGRL